MRSNRLPLLLSLTASIALIVSSVAVASPSSASNGDTVDVIVALHDGAAPGGHEANKARAARIAREHGVEPSQTYGTALFGFAASVPQARLNGLRNDPRVDYVDRDAPVEAYGQTAPWGITRVGAPVSSNRGAGIHVYVLDTGIDSDHPDLEANLSPDGHAVESCKGPRHRCKQPWDDDHGHGTHVAGTVAAVDNGIDVVGVAPEATLHAVKVLSNSGSGSRSGVIAGIDWVTHHVGSHGYGGKAVVNMSLGGSGSKSGTCSSTGFSGSDSYHESICSSKNAGVVFAVAAGNSNADAAEHVPAAYDDAVITVSATKEGDDWPYWSNWGDDSADWAPWDSAPVAIAAPGAGVLSTALGGGTTTMSGTSMAAPHVAGAVALYLAANEQTTPASAFSNAREALLGSSERTWDGSRYVNGWKNTSGYVHHEDFLDVGAFTISTGLAVSGLSASPDPFSPNDDGTKDATTVSFSLNKAATWTLAVSDAASEALCSTSGSTIDPATVEVSWAGTDGTNCADGATLADGVYTVTVSASAGSETDSAATSVVIDTDAPAITGGPGEQNVASSSADITWSTDEATDATVVYSTTAGQTDLNEGTPVTDATLATAHTVSLTELSAESTYYYKVHSRDAAGNLVSSAERSFTTPVATVTSVHVITPSGTDGYATNGGKDGTRHLSITVTLRDGGGAAVANASVDIRLYHEGKVYGTATGTTGTDGTVTFSANNAPSGTYTTDVTSVAATGYEWDGATPTNSFTK